MKFLCSEMLHFNERGKIQTNAYITYRMLIRANEKAKTGDDISRIRLVTGGERGRYLWRLVMEGLSNKMTEIKTET